jgi:BirA family transcriptional regulator, biotin operon repressor / biotin---[acetyl-CoA-carboxylase] ligase
MIDLAQILRETFIARAEYHPSIGSTNNRAAQCAAQGVKDLPLLIVADEQTAGRGRGGKRWWTGRGALALSLLVDPRTVAAEESRSPLVALASALAVVDTVAPLLPEHRVGIHWPNDVFVDGRKLAGILVEVLPDRSHVIGIGLNTNNSLTNAPAELQATAATLRDLSRQEHDQTRILLDLLRHLDRTFAQLRADPKAIAARANQLCLQQGRPATVRRGNETIAGCCRGIAADGAILLETPNGLEAFHSGTLES